MSDPIGARCTCGWSHWGEAEETQVLAAGHALNMSMLGDNPARHAVMVTDSWDAWNATEPSMGSKLVELWQRFESWLRKGGHDDEQQ